MSFVVIAKWTAKPGQEREVAEVLARLVAPSSAEPGCLAYIVHRAINDRQTFVLYERYVDQAGYEAHGASSHFQELAVARGFPLLVSRERMFLEPDED